MVNEYLTRAYDTKVIFRELLCFYAPFGWVPVKENRAPSPNPPVHKMYDGNTVWSMEKQDYVSDYDVGRKRSEKIVVKRNTKFTRNNRLMTEEALMEYHLRWRYWFYPRCNKLRLINRCRPFWGSLWALCFILFMFMHLVLAYGAPKISPTADGEYVRTVTAQTTNIAYQEGNIYFINYDTEDGTRSFATESGFYKVEEDKLYYTKNLANKFTLYKGSDVKVVSMPGNEGNVDVIAFSNMEVGDQYCLYISKSGVFSDVYVGLVGLLKDTEKFFSVFWMITYILAAFNFVMLIYQLYSNWWLKKNTERIIGCCVNAKAIVKAMQYEDITLMNGRQRQRYYQGQVYNEAMRNTGDPLYFGS